MPTYAVLFNLFQAQKDLWLPESFIAKTDEKGLPAHIEHRANPKTIAGYGIEKTTALDRAFFICERLAVAALEARFSPPKAKKMTPLADLAGDPTVKKAIDAFVHRELDLLFLTLLEHDFFLTLDAEKKAVISHFLLRKGPTLEPDFFFRKVPIGLDYELRLSENGHKSFKISSKKVVVALTNQPGWLAIEGQICRLEGLRGWMTKPFIAKDKIEIRAAQVREYFQKIILPQTDRSGLDRLRAEGFEASDLRGLKAARLELIPLALGSENGLENWAVKPVFEYQEGAEFLFREKRTHRTRLFFGEKHADIRLAQIHRDLEDEAFLIEKLKENGFSEADGAVFQMKNETEKGSFFHLAARLSEKKAALEKAGWRLEPPFFEDKKIAMLEPFLTEKIALEAAENDWFDLRGMIQIGDFKIPFGRFLSAIKSGERFFKLPDGQFWPIPNAWFEQYESVAVFGKEGGADGFRILKKHTSLLPGFDKNANKTTEKRPEIDFPKSLKAELYPYQKDGFRWLVEHFLAKNGCLLADDMGLGKTLQTIALLLFAKENSANFSTEKDDETAVIVQLDLFAAHVEKIKPMRALVVAPASLVTNWAREIARFSTDLFVLQHIGPRRADRPEPIASHDIVLTTYQTALADSALLQKIEWQAIVLDEAHVLKNRLAETSKAIRSLPTKYRLALTGTPIENRLSDLFSQMDWLNPALLGSASFFQSHFSNPIEKTGDARRAEQLQKLVAPYILRRTKSQVGRDLPPLTEKLLFPEMSAAQKELYEKEKSAARNLLAQPGAATGLAFGNQILPALTRLRQLACHPILTKKDFEGESGKFSAVIEAWEELTESGQKVLIFSSFVEHLRLFRTHFEKRGERVAWLTGESSTAERARAVDDFSNEKDCRIMLSSLKAGGVGLNLTAAEYVFLLDPWWNPAAENQAIARAHRNGQERPVVALRFVSKDSIEEKIIDLQRRKRALSDAILDFEAVPKLEKADLDFLLA